VSSLSRKRSSYRYVLVIQPAIGWAKYLELSEYEVKEFLVGLLEERKRYARELEFPVPESVKCSW